MDLNIWTFESRIQKILGFVSFSLDQLVTKYQMSSIWKEKRTARPLIFLNWHDNKKIQLTFGISYLIFSHQLIQWKENCVVNVANNYLFAFYVKIVDNRDEACIDQCHH